MLSVVHKPTAVLSECLGRSPFLVGRIVTAKSGMPPLVYNRVHKCDSPLPGLKTQHINPPSAQGYGEHDPKSLASELSMFQDFLY